MEEEESINIREVIDIVLSGRWIVLATVAVVTFAGLVIALTTDPIFRATGIVQIEQEKSQLSASLGQLSALTGSAPPEATAEIAILKSRMVLGEVAENLKLYISIKPNYFPLIGETIARNRQSRASVAPALFGLDEFAWGGEEIAITALDVPKAWEGKSLTLIATQSGYAIYVDPKSPALFEGKVGVREVRKLSADSLESIEIFVQTLKARPRTKFIIARQPTSVVYNGLVGNVNVMEQPRDSGIITIEVMARSPTLAAAVTNEIQSIFLRQNVERKSAQAQQSLEFLKEQLPVLRQRVDESRAKLNSYQLQKGSVDVQKETDLVLSRSVELETQRQNFLQQRDISLQRFTAQHPVVATLNEQIRAIEREQVALKRQVESLPETQQEILSLIRDLEVNNQLYTGLLNSSQELQVAKAGTVGSIRIIDTALVPNIPFKPNKKVIVASSLFVGLVLGVFAVFAMRTLLRGVDRPEEVERVLGLPTYASIPYSRAQNNLVRRWRGKGEENLLLASVDSNDTAIEALRGLRASLHFAMMEASNNILMITGPIASLGKSFVTINLGAVLAMSGKRVLVIDADLRRGYLHRHLGIEQKPGLSDCISGTVEEAAILRKSPVPGLDFISCGSRPPNPAEILMSERFASLLERLSKGYDYVLIDTPPVLPVADAAIVGRLVGSTFIVIKSGEHPMRTIQETVKRLGQAGVNVSGTVFNQVGAKIGSYGYGAYGYHYGYSSYGYKPSGEGTESR